MTWALERFGSVTLPTGVPAMPVGTGPTRLKTVPTSDGYYDAYGDDRAELELPYTLMLRATTTGATQAALYTTLHTLKALRGKRQLLYRRTAGSNVEWCEARLVRLPIERSVENVRHQEIEIEFQVLTQWYGANHGAWTLDAGEILDGGLVLDSADTTTITASPQTVTVANDGDTVCTNAIITITAGDANITALGLDITSVADLNWTGTLLATKALVIDCGAKSVKNDGADAASGFSTGASHASNYWLPLEPGNNSVIVTNTGGLAGIVDPVISFEFSEPME